MDNKICCFCNQEIEEDTLLDLSSNKFCHEACFSNYLQETAELVDFVSWEEDLGSNLGVSAFEEEPEVNDLEALYGV